MVMNRHGAPKPPPQPASRTNAPSAGPAAAARVVVEGAVILIPCLVGLGIVCQSLLASRGKITINDLAALADTLSLWALLATGGFCVTRLMGDALCARGAPTPWKAVHDRVVARVLAVLVGFGGLLVCEPLGDTAERWFTALTRTLVPSATLHSSIGTAAVVVQFAVTSIALAAVVKMWHLVSSRCLGLNPPTKAR